jgi:hypothetical protein
MSFFDILFLEIGIIFTFYPLHFSQKSVFFVHAKNKKFPWRNIYIQKNIGRAFDCGVSDATKTSKILRNKIYLQQHSPW